MSASFSDWVPKDPGYRRDIPPEGSERADRKTVSKEQVLAGLNLYKRFLDNQKKVITSGVALRSTLDEFKQNVRKSVATFTEGLDTFQESQVRAADQERSELFRGIINLSTQKDSLALYLFIYLLVAFMLSLLGLHLIIRIFNNDLAGKIFAANSLLNIFTVFVLVTSIVILAMSGKLEGRELSTLIAAISGYVLGQLGRQSPEREASQTTQQPQFLASPLLGRLIRDAAFL